MKTSFSFVRNWFQLKTLHVVSKRLEFRLECLVDWFVRASRRVTRRGYSAAAAAAAAAAETTGVIWGWTLMASKLCWLFLRLALKLIWFEFRGLRLRWLLIWVCFCFCYCWSSSLSSSVFGKLRLFWEFNAWLSDCWYEVHEVHAWKKTTN